MFGSCIQWSTWVGGVASPRWSTPFSVTGVSCVGARHRSSHCCNVIVCRWTNATSHHLTARFRRCRTCTTRSCDGDSPTWCGGSFQGLSQLSGITAATRAGVGPSFGTGCADVTSCGLDLWKITGRNLRLFFVGTRVLEEFGKPGCVSNMAEISFGEEPWAAVGRHLEWFAG